MIRSVIGIGIFTAILTALLSLVARVPYIYTVCSVAILVVAGHIVTLDDDYPGGWSNQQNEVSVWRGSLIELAIKITIVVILILAIVFFPALKEFGA